MQIMLCDIQPGDEAVVTDISDENRLKGRLREFGMIPGTALRCRFLSPGRDLVALELRGTVLAVRCRDLTGIQARRCL